MELYFRKEWKAPAVVGAISFSAGAAVGYLVCLKRTKTVLVEEVTIDTVDEDGYLLESQKETITTEIREQIKADFQRAVENIQESIKRNQDEGVIQFPQPRWASDDGRLPFKGVEAPRFPTHPNPEPELEDGETVDEWDQEAEEADRSPNAPYVIHQDEFVADEKGYRQTALEYFAGDEILVDEKNVPIYNMTKIVGKLEFGRGSNDSDVVYIRNDELESEFEVTRNHGSYQVEILGLDAEEAAEEEDLKHSNVVRKFRID